MKSRIVFSSLLAIALFLAPGVSDARYYNPDNGRFQTMDTFEGQNQDPLSLHKYLYAHSDPVNNVDKNGHWPTSVLHVHQNAIDYSLSFLPDDEVDILKDQQAAMDASTFQTSAYAHYHAMRGPGESAENAWRKSNQWIYDQISLARDLEKQGKRRLALEALGNAIHTLQDSTSPAHKGFQLWDDKWKNRSKPVVSHVLNELYDPGRGSDLYKITEQAYIYFRSKSPLPTTFIPKPVNPLLMPQTSLTTRVNSIPMTSISFSFSVYAP